MQTNDLISSELDGEMVLVSLNQAAYYGLDASAQSIWKIIDQPCRVADLCEQLLTKYDVDPTACEAHVCDPLNYLNKEGSIRVATKNSG